LGALGMSVVTGPTEEVWREFNDTPNLRAALVETSFPNALQGLSDISGHLTPHTLRQDVGKLARRRKKKCEVLLYHLKPAFMVQLRNELDELKVPGRVLELDEHLVY